MTEVIPIVKLSNDGFLQPANNVSYAIPDNVTHAQLRYDNFLSPNTRQGSYVTSAISSFEFTILETLLNWYFKLYLSTDGITYYEDKGYGGTLGKKYIGESFINAEDFAAGDLIAVTGTVGNKVFEGKRILEDVLKYKELVFQLTQVGAGNLIMAVRSNTTGKTYASTIPRIDPGFFQIIPGGVVGNIGSPFIQYHNNRLYYDANDTDTMLSFGLVSVQVSAAGQIDIATTNLAGDRADGVLVDGSVYGTGNFSVIVQFYI